MARGKNTAVAAAPEPVPPATPTLKTIAGTPVIKPEPAFTKFKLRTVPVAASKFTETFGACPT